MISLNKLSMGVFNDTQGFATNQKNVENSQLEKLDLKTIIQSKQTKHKLFYIILFQDLMQIMLFRGGLVLQTK